MSGLILNPRNATQRVQGRRAMFVAQTKRNLLKNGGFFNEEYWTLGIGWKVANGFASMDGSQVAVASISQAVPAMEERDYRLIYNLNISAGLVIANIGALLSGANATSGQFSAILPAGPAHLFAIEGSADFVGNIDDIVLVPA